MRINRRTFLLRTGACALQGAGLVGTLAGLAACQSTANAAADADRQSLAVEPRVDPATGLELLELPPDFSYVSFGWTGDPMTLGLPTPRNHDGMGVLGAAGSKVELMRNHEIAIGPRLGDAPVPVYDAWMDGGDAAYACGGGTTALAFDIDRLELISTEPTLAGTLVNCAGGATPWGSWLTAEEAVVLLDRAGGRRHGYVFEVPAPGQGPASAQPVIGMGLMKHEAAAVDPVRSDVYLTEDNDGFDSGFYRYRPRDTRQQPGSLARGGVLEMLKVRGKTQADLRRPRAGASYDVEWVPIADPDLPPKERGGRLSGGMTEIMITAHSGPYVQGFGDGAARFARLEGCVWHDRLVYFVDTAGGTARSGAVWAYDPAAARLECIFVARQASAVGNPDNISLSPSGLIVVCEDSARRTGTRLVAIRADGSAVVLAENNVVIKRPLPGRPAIEPGDYRRFEFAGACFDPSGRVLFVNVQVPGVTFAITGPWEQLAAD